MAPLFIWASVWNSCGDGFEVLLFVRVRNAETWMSSVS